MDFTTLSNTEFSELLNFLYGQGITRMLIPVASAFIYSIFLKRKLKVPLFIGLIATYIPAIFLPITIVGPIYLLLWYIYRIGFKKKEQIMPIEKVGNETHEDSFVFETLTEPIILSNPYRGIYINGGAGSGKSESIIKPLIYQSIQNGFCGIVYDFKSPELTEYVFRTFGESNTPVIPSFIDFKDAKRSKRVNPLNPNLMTKTAYASEYAQTLLWNLSPNNIKNENYWMMDAKSVLTGIIWYLKKEHPQYCTLPHIISLVLYCDINTLLEKVSLNNEAGGFVSSLRQAIKSDASKQVAGVLSNLQANLAKLNTPDIFWILSGSELDLNINEPNNPKFLCIGTESSLADTYAPVVSLLISVATKQMNAPGKHKSIIILDEAPTLYIPNFEQIPATARSNKVATVYAGQDFSQMIDRYGSDKAQVILSNMGTQFYGRTVNKNTASMVNQLFGKADKKFTSVSKGDNYHNSSMFGKHINSNTINTSESLQERDRVKITDIMNLRPGEFYGFIAEGNKNEILQTQFLIPTSKPSAFLGFESYCTENEIELNYEKIISESKSIIEEKKMENTLDDLIKF